MVSLSSKTLIVLNTYFESLVQSKCVLIILRLIDRHISKTSLLSRFNPVLFCTWFDLLQAFSICTITNQFLVYKNRKMTVSAIVDLGGWACTSQII